MIDLWKNLLLYTARFCIDKGITQTTHAASPHIRRLLLRVFFDKTGIQLLYGNTQVEGGCSNRTKPSVLFVFMPEHSSTLYRVTNQMEQLALQGIKSDSATVWDLRLLRYVDWYDVFVFHRVPDSRILTAMLKRLKQHRKVTIYDIDDLDFAPNLLKRPTPILTELGIANRALMMKCDYVITSTEFLAKLVRDMGKIAFVKRNCLNVKQMKISEEAFKCRKYSDKVRVGYFSGTPTHDHDFLEVTEALIRIMEEHESVDLYVGGFLTLSTKFSRFGHRIKKIPFCHWEKLPFHIALVDINLAPLERDNLFSEGKSELKYFEAGILGIPTIATPTDAFKFAIKHGVNGLLASDTEDWYKCLDLLVTNESLRKSIGENARQHVKDFYDPYYGGKSFMDIFEQILPKKI